MVPRERRAVDCGHGARGTGVGRCDFRRTARGRSGVLCLRNRRQRRRRHGVRAAAVRPVSLHNRPAEGAQTSRRGGKPCPGARLRHSGVRACRRSAAPGRVGGRAVRHGAVPCAVRRGSRADRADQRRPRGVGCARLFGRHSVGAERPHGTGILALRARRSDDHLSVSQDRAGARRWARRGRRGRRGGRRLSRLSGGRLRCEAARCRRRRAPASAAAAKHPQGSVRPSADRRRLARHGRRGGDVCARGAAVGRGAGHGRMSGVHRSRAANPCAAGDVRAARGVQRRDCRECGARASGGAAREGCRRRRLRAFPPCRAGGRSRRARVRSARRGGRRRAQFAVRTARTARPAPSASCADPASRRGEAAASRRCHGGRRRLCRKAGELWERNRVRFRASGAAGRL